MELAGNLDEFAERLIHAQNGDIGGNAGFKPLTDQARSSLRGSELIGIFQIVEKSQMHRAGFVKRSQSRDRLSSP